ncbi:MAG: PEP-CTERM-box response regulator transcription factor [Pseudomonadota bacterium]
MTKLLVIEDDPGLQKQLKWCFEEFDVLVAEDGASAVENVREHQPPVVTLDLGLPPDPANASEGLRTLDEILRIAPDTKVIVVTGNDDREVAVEAVGRGAYDFYEKPVDPKILHLIVARAKSLHELEAENRLLGPRRSDPLEGVIAGSSQMLEVCRRIEKIAPADVTVLLLGESGTGKEVLARALHNLSDRRDEPFIAINCAAIPENLLESELFGYEKGAFTSANRQTKGKLEFANGGTLFLDEIGDLPAALQAKLLRFLQERVIERVGGREEIPVDTRVICATHKNLDQQREQELFREDLFYRVSEVTINIPPLRERPGDKILIARAFLETYKAEQKSKVRDFDAAALQAIETYEWPGNVRELENRVKRAVIMVDGSHISPDDLELPTSEKEGFETLKDIREAAEADAINRALAASGGNVGKAANVLGVSRPTVYHMMKKYGIQAA